MSEENTAPEGGFSETEIRLQSAEEGVNIADASRIRLEITGDAEMVAGLFEFVLALVQAGGGYVDRAMTESGQDITDQFRPSVIDPFDLGDDPVA